MNTTTKNDLAAIVSPALVAAVAALVGDLTWNVRDEYLAKSEGGQFFSKWSDGSWRLRTRPYGGTEWALSNDGKVLKVWK